MPYDQSPKFTQPDEAGLLKRFNELLAQMAAVNAQYTDEEVQADLKEASRVVQARKRK